MSSFRSNLAGLVLFAVCGTHALADDMAITARIKSDLVDDPKADVRQVRVTTLNGVVQLSGTVQSDLSKQRAEILASTTEGVSDVRNQLIVRPAHAFR